MIKIKVYTVGKTKKGWLEEALEIYETRLTGTLSIEWIFLKDDKHLEQALKKEPSFICLDPQGKSVSSPCFASFIESSRLVFVIGGSEGIPKSILAAATRRISLSPLTFTHQLVRLILVEQLYRAVQVIQGSPYDK